jgi:hypothetical protein
MGDLSSALKILGHKADLLLHPMSGLRTNSAIPSLSYIFMTECLSKHRNNLGAQLSNTFFCGVFNDTVSNSHNTALNDKV